MKRKSKRVPEVLWRLFGNRARTLSDTIVALIPPPLPVEGGCRCPGRRCLSCSADEAMSFLVRSGDSSDYHKLLSRCFVVVSENAPPIPFFDPHRRWPQCEIVRRSIESILKELPSSSNLICCSYDKGSRSSPVVDELTSLKWTVLLRRIGEALMMYLLKYTSIFLPLSQKQHHQITGCPISNLCFKLSRPMLEPKPQHRPLMYTGSKKRKKVEGVESSPNKRICTYSLGLDPSLTSGSSCVSKEEHSHKEREVSSNKNSVVSQKRTRNYRPGQRKRRKLVLQGAPSLIPCGRNNCNRDNLSLCATSSQVGPDDISPCFCCSVFLYEPKMNKNTEINRKNIFYKLENSTSMFPRNHILHTLKADDSGASVLCNSIFETFGIDNNAGTIPCFHGKDGCSINSTCLYHSLIKLLKILIRKSQNCRYLRLLEKHCSRFSYQDASMATGTGLEVISKANDLGTTLSMSGQDGAQSDGESFHAANAKSCSMIPEATADQVEPSKSCPKKDVVSFIWAICRRIVPSPLLGEPSYWRILRRNISRFIELRRFEKFSLKECTYQLKVSKFPLFSSKDTGCSKHGVTHSARHAILKCWMFWFFEHLVSPLVQANFYVTESEHEKQEVLYYLKSTWEKQIREAECMMGDRYCLLDYASTMVVLQNRSFGFSKVRLLPKKHGFRMLTNLRAPSRMLKNPPYSKSHPNKKLRRRAFCNREVPYLVFKSVNYVLQDLHVVLKGLRAKEPEKLGSSVFDYNDIYRKLVPYLFLLKNGSTIMPSVFMVVSDVSKAFDSINQDKLISVMKDVIVDDEFALEKLTHVICSKKSLKVVHQHQTSAHQNMITSSARIRPRLHACSLGSVSVKKKPSRRIRKEEIDFILKEHITCNVVKLGSAFYMQRVGIPQGSVLSSLLFSYYYGHMERNVLFPFLEKANGDLLGAHHASVSEGNSRKELFAHGCEYLLLRFIDDFLFVSTSEKQASMFFTRLKRGVRDYNCCMNNEKYGVNFNMDKEQGLHSSRLHIGKDGISFLRWSGLLLNCSTLEIQADYTRYVNSHLSSTLTVSCRGKVGSYLKAKLHNYLRPKCHPIFYDLNINSPGVVRLNIYQSFLLCAMKFVSHMSNLSVLPAFTPKFYINVISTSISYMHRLIKRKMYSFEDPAFRPKHGVKKKEIIWLGLYAYSRVLKKKQSRYKTLLRMLESKLKAYKKVENMSPELKYAVDDAHSSVLWSIRY